MDRSVKPGDSFWDFALGSWLKNHDSMDNGTLLNAYLNRMDVLMTGLLESTSDHHTLQLLMGSKLTKEEEKAAMERVYAQLKQGNDISKADVMYNIGKMADMGFFAFMGHAVLNIDGTIRYYILPGLAWSSIKLTNPKEEQIHEFKLIFEE